MCNYLFDCMKVFIVGAGKLANAIIDAQICIPNCEFEKWDAQYSHVLNNRSIVVHAGSGRELQQCIDFCSRTQSVLVELSTGLKTEMLDPDFPLIVCPNISILILKTLHMFKAYGHGFSQFDISITESHQASKTAEPGTAYAFAHSLHVPVGNVVSVRDPHIQENEIGIPAQFLDKHAYHQIVIKDGNDQVVLQTKVLGHSSYAKGVRAIVRSVALHTLECKRYTVLDLIDAGLL